MQSYNRLRKVPLISKVDLAKNRKKVFTKEHTFLLNFSCDSSDKVLSRSTMEQQSSDVPFSRLNCIDTLTQYIQKIPVNGNAYK